MSINEPISIKFLKCEIDLGSNRPKSEDAIVDCAKLCLNDIYKGRDIINTYIFIDKSSNKIITYSSTSKSYSQRPNYVKTCFGQLLNLHYNFNDPDNIKITNLDSQNFYTDLLTALVTSDIKSLVHPKDSWPISCEQLSSSTFLILDIYLKQKDFFLLTKISPFAWNSLETSVNIINSLLNIINNNNGNIVLKALLLLCQQQQDSDVILLATYQNIFNDHPELRAFLRSHNIGHQNSVQNIVDIPTVNTVEPVNKTTENAGNIKSSTETPTSQNAFPTFIRTPTQIKNLIKSGEKFAEDQIPIIDFPENTNFSQGRRNSNWGVIRKYTPDNLLAKAEQIYSKHNNLDSWNDLKKLFESTLNLALPDKGFTH